MVDVVRVKHEGLRSRWRAHVRVSAAGFVTVSAATKRGVRRRAAALPTYVAPPLQRVPLGMRPRWPRLGQTVVEEITGRRLTWDGVRWVG